MRRLAAGVIVGAGLLGCGVATQGDPNERVGLARQRVSTAVPAKLVHGVGDPINEVRLFSMDSPEYLSVNYEWGDELALGDINHDGADEIVLGRRGGGIWVYDQAGSPLSFPSTDPFIFTEGEVLETGDLNYDGYDELIYGQNPGPGPGGLGHIYLLARPGVDLDDFFQGDDPGFQEHSDLAVCDLNNDGFDEIVRAPAWEVWSNPSTTPVTLSQLFPSGPPVSYYPQSDRIVCADFNADGYDDLAVVFAASGGGSVFGDIDFYSVPAATPVTVSPEPPFENGSDIAAGDLNGDGVAEIVVAHRPATLPIGTVEVYDASGDYLDFLPNPELFYAGESIAVGRLHFPPCTPTAPTDTTCNNVDDDCDGQLDEDVATTSTCGVGECQNSGTAACVDGVLYENCTPLPPSPEGPPDGKDNDCDGVVDNEACDGVDNDGNGQIDDAVGSCIQRHLFVPMCWDGTQAEFDAAVERWRGFFLQSGVLAECSNKFWFEAAPMDLLGCPDDADLPDALNFDTGRYAKQNWDTISVVEPFQPGCIAGMVLGDGFISLTSGAESPYAGEYTVFTHEWGHHWIGLREEYSSARNGSPNWLVAEYGCDPASDYSTDPSACCGRDYPISCPSIPAGTFCLGNWSLNLTDWEWGDSTVQFWGDGSRCIMSNASAPGWDTGNAETGVGSHRGWCVGCWQRWIAEGPRCTHVFPGGSRLLSITGTAVPQPMLGGDRALALSPGLDGSIEIGRQGPPMLPTGGDTTFTVMTPAGTVLGEFAPLVQGSGPEQSIDVPVAFWVRIPVEQDVVLPLVMTTTDPSGTTTQSTLGGSPPTAVLENVTAECQADGVASVILDGTASSDPDGDTLYYGWDAGAVALAPDGSSSPTGSFPVGSNPVSLTVSDGTVASNIASATVTVVDTTPPTLTAPDPVTASICDASAIVTIGEPTAVDACLGDVPATGEVISTNGTLLPTPIPVVDGEVELGVGDHTVRWTASDGVQTVTTYQTVTVGPAIQSSQSFVLEDRASLRVGSDYAPLFNSGTGVAKLGNDALSADIFSVGAIDVEHRAWAYGVARSATSVFVQPDGHVTEGTSVGPVILPALPVLPSFTVPGGSGITVNTSRTLTPGSYSSVTANSGATLVFTTGDYYIGDLTINSSVTLRASADTRIYVKRTLAFRSSFRTTSNQIQPVFLGLAGTSATTIEAPFDGELVAPNAAVTFGVGNGFTCSGSFYAKVLWLRPGSSLRCVEP